MKDEYRFTVSTPEELAVMLKDEQYIREFCNYVVIDLMKQTDAWVKTFRIDTPMLPSMRTKMHRWIQKDVVKKWMTKANKSLEIDWIDKKVDILERMYLMATDELKDKDGDKIEVPLKLQASTGKDWLDAIKADKTIKVDMGENTQINIVQIVQDKLETITGGATIQPDIVEAILIESK